MKKYTNHSPGLRGINTDQGVVWIETGASAQIDPKTIIGELPDLGKASDAKASDTAELDALKVQFAELTKQVETLCGEKADLAKDNAELTKQVETLTAPKK
jgi:hypothetical protein